MRVPIVQRMLSLLSGGSWPASLALAGVAVLALVGASLGVLRTVPPARSSGEVPQAIAGPAASLMKDAALGLISASGSVERSAARGAPAPAAGEPEGAIRDTGGTRIWVPFRSQWDGSTFEWGNCGVAAITMAMEYFGHNYSTHAVRESINVMTGNWNTHIGVDWRYLKAALERRDFAVTGPHNARGGYVQWTLADLVAQVEQGRPPILLVHYRSLPGHDEDEWFGDHYIIFLGLTGDGRVVYHDPGFPNQDGAYLTIDQEQFERAWSNTWIGQNRTAMVVIGPG